MSPYVDNIMLHANPFRNYCVALVVASQPAVEDWALKQGIAFIDFSDLCQKEETVKEVHASLVKVGLLDKQFQSHSDFGIILGTFYSQHSLCSIHLCMLFLHTNFCWATF